MSDNSEKQTKKVYKHPPYSEIMWVALTRGNHGRGIALSYIKRFVKELYDVPPNYNQYLRPCLLKALEDGLLTRERHLYFFTAEGKKERDKVFRAISWETESDEENVKEKKSVEMEDVPEVQLKPSKKTSKKKEPVIEEEDKVEEKVVETKKEKKPSKKSSKTKNKQSEKEIIAEPEVEKDKEVKKTPKSKKSENTSETNKKDKSTTNKKEKKASVTREEKKDESSKSKKKSRKSNN
eukprot:TRINITY_DN2724_c0_g1_i4.p1 TRINITY_DN2724_c0_g1~~TRINITY_DN2724_c0_g1_i4.p1  ORF type:complete len:237 (-),score=78.02 TRINITY_DN2724_c0_g1_i4:31-741(-)